MTAVSPSSSTMTPIARPQTGAWKQLTVSDFLRQVNWSSQPDPVAASAQSAAVSVEDLHLQMSVSQFFAAIPWTGEIQSEVQLPAIASPNEAKPTAEPLPLDLPDLDEFADGAGDAGENLTLDDFFDSFSDF